MSSASPECLIEDGPSNNNTNKKMLTVTESAQSRRLGLMIGLGTSVILLVQAIFVTADLAYQGPSSTVFGLALFSACTLLAAGLLVVFLEWRKDSSSRFL